MSDDTTPLKKCSKCKQEFPATREYFSTTGKRNTLTCYCKPCLNQMARDRRVPHPRQIRIANRKFKRCSQCKQEFPATREYFHANKAINDGLGYKCKACEKARRATCEYLERKKQGYKHRVANDPDYRKKRREAGREYNLKHPEVVRKGKETNRKRYATDAEYRQKVLKRTGERHRIPEVSAREKELARVRNQTEKAKAARRERSHHRRALSIGASGSHTKEDVAAQYKAQKGKCWHCGKPLNGKYHIDHLIPLSRGGTNWPNNIVCSCEKCNLSKHDKFCHEWNGRLF